MDCIVISLIVGLVCLVVKPVVVGQVQVAPCFLLYIVCIFRVAELVIQEMKYRALLLSLLSSILFSVVDF